MLIYQIYQNIHLSMVVPEMGCKWKPKIWAFFFKTTRGKHWCLSYCNSALTYTKFIQYTDFIQKKSRGVPNSAICPSCHQTRLECSSLSNSKGCHFGVTAVNLDTSQWWNLLSQSKASHNSRLEHQSFGINNLSSLMDLLQLAKWWYSMWLQHIP